MAPRAFGVPVGTLLGLAKRLGKDHALAGALWKTGWYEARMLASMVDDPRAVTRAQMNAWAADFDNWGICDTACLYLFDREGPPCPPSGAPAGSSPAFEECLQRRLRGGG